MKKFTCILLVAVLLCSVFCFTGCGKINKSEISILWSGSGRVEDPNSLINAFERTFYIQNLSYKHYGADGDVSKQTEQAKAAIDAGAQVLVIELVNVDPVASQLRAKEIVDYAKANNVPVVFFNCLVDENIVKSYDKCVYVSADTTTIADVQGQMIADLVKANFKVYDKNEDGRISAVIKGIGTIAKPAVEKANEVLGGKKYKVSKGMFSKKFNTSIEICDADIFDAEMILTEDDVTAFAVLLKLQEKDYNTDKLTTQAVPIITVGQNVDYKAAVLAGRPAIPENLVINEGDSNKVVKQKNKEIRKIQELMDYYESKKFLVDLTVVDESDVQEMVYTTIDVVDAGRIAGTVIEDRDAIAKAVAQIVRNFVKGKTPTLKVQSKEKKNKPMSVVVKDQFVKVRYIAHSNS